MNITREQVDALNAIVKVAVTKEDYTEKVEKVLADYKKMLLFLDLEKVLCQ